MKKAMPKTGSLRPMDTFHEVFRSCHSIRALADLLALSNPDMLNPQTVSDTAAIILWEAEKLRKGLRVLHKRLSSSP